ncbi:hypothetical protein ABFS82_03G079700 [Erythranthe guttata]|uniref:DUF241 domain-containing protein n=1 Tax=Erythranthe guttata TaxID=4155 RepID=A0A022PTF8_ERYGU|nr:PREDICTED: uncharacterized protein LOC105950659 [Erythranthe guttata]EYU17520.1 hypothetical protein MIMGU_mgv1a017768mg [Erythranthe guttata]|eukprot:XP_012829479.1 PREDICTED: uncharacterized protein LOC105950659 [Erythranthe guttata]
MATANHSRSKSFPSQSHPAIESVEDHLCRLRADSESTSVCSNLASLKNLHEGINDLIQMPSVQQTLSQGNWINELLEGSLKLVDLCALSREIVCLIKESVQDLESSIRRNKAETATSSDISAYVASRKKIAKMVNRSIKNLKSFNHKSTTDNDLWTMLKEAESHDLSVLKSVLILLSGENEKSSKTSWSLLSKFTTQNSRVYSESGAEDLSLLNIQKSTKNMDSKNMLKQLKSSEMIIQEIEEGLEALFRSLVENRVSLLNVLSH